MHMNIKNDIIPANCSVFGVRHKNRNKTKNMRMNDVDSIELKYNGLFGHPNAHSLNIEH